MKNSMFNLMKCNVDVYRIRVDLEMIQSKSVDEEKTFEIQKVMKMYHMKGMRKDDIRCKIFFVTYICSLC